jgi:hypothetical protein
MHRIEARRGGDPVWNSRVAADAAGAVEFTIDANASEPLDVIISCAGAGPT